MDRLGSQRKWRFIGSLHLLPEGEGMVLLTFRGGRRWSVIVDHYGGYVMLVRLVGR